MTMMIAVFIVVGAFGVLMLLWRPWPSRISGLRRDGDGWAFAIDGRGARADSEPMRVHYGDDMVYIGSQVEHRWFARYADDGRPVPAYIAGRPDGLDDAIRDAVAEEGRLQWLAEQGKRP